MSDYDVIVLGGGPGGYLAAERLGHAGKKVALIEADALGGTCLNVGCIPTKTLLNSAKIYAHAVHGEQFGVKAEASYDWAKMQSWKEEVVKTLVAGVGSTEKAAGVKVIKGYGRYEGPGRVSVDGKALTCEHVILATGSVPVMPPIPGTKDNPRVVDSTGLLSIPEVPKRLAVIGGGVIGVEFASLFSMLGSEVTVIEMLDEIVPFADADIAKTMRKAMKDVTFKLGCKVESVDDGKVNYTTKAGKAESFEADTILMAVGRKPALTGWGLEGSGIEHTKQGITVDEFQRTNVANVWAIGDVTGRSLLAHAAYRMAEVAAANILDDTAYRRGEILRVDYIPWAVYTQPEAAGVGLTEAAAKERGYQVKVGTAPAYMSGRHVAENGVAAPGLAKVIVDAESSRVLGVHVVATYASEMIWGMAAVCETELTITELRQLVFPHPTVSEMIREAAWAVKI